MPVNGPILVIEDDPNDADVIATAITDIGVKNQINKFPNSKSALDYLMTTKDKPLVILCDIRMPEQDGLAFLRHINQTEYLRKKSIPFIFLTGVASTAIVNEAYDIGAQGFFKKADSYAGIKDQLLSILVYWKQCLHPNREDLG